LGAGIALVALISGLGSSTAVARVNLPAVQLQNQETGLCMATPPVYASASVFQRRCGSGRSQHWDLWSRRGMVNQYSGLCLRLGNRGSNSVYQLSCRGEQYVSVPFPEGSIHPISFQLRNPRTGGCLAVSSYAIGARVFEWNCITGNFAQLWAAIP
jgi:hypothetical protein